jgi:hypothetical protein
MLTTTLGITYVGATLCYAASPKAAGGAGLFQAWASPGRLRLGGLLLLGLALGSALTEWPVGEALLVWGTMGMAAFSLLVVAAPLVDRFVPTSGALALTIAVLALWL